MKIIIGETAGFCFGVSNAVTKTKEALKKYKHVSCLGELVHNKQVTKDLEKNGLKFINNINEAKENVIIRAHGEQITTYENAKKLNVNIIDLTCPKVLKIHNIVEEYSKKNYYIFLIGQKEHPETIGTISYCKDNSSIIENKEQVCEAINKFNKSNLKDLLVISQTTFSIEKFNDIINLIKENIEQNVNLEVNNTICNATKLRQEETKKISMQVDFMIIIGGKHSSNTTKLYQIANDYCKNSILIETSKELASVRLKMYNSIGIMAGASTPKESINSVIEFIKKVC